MQEKITAQVGQIIEVSGKQYRATEGGFEHIVSKGALGGELKRLDQCKIGQRVIAHASVGDNCSLDFDGLIGRNFIVETNIPARPTFTPMTAGEAARIPNMAGRWIAVKVDSQDGVNIHIEADTAYLGEDNQILLIEGADL